MIHAQKQGHRQHKSKACIFWTRSVFSVLNLRILQEVGSDFVLDIVAYYFLLWVEFTSLVLQIALGIGLSLRIPYVGSDYSEEWCVCEKFPWPRIPVVVWHKNWSSALLRIRDTCVFATENYYQLNIKFLANQLETTNPHKTKPNASPYNWRPQNASYNLYA